MKIALLSMLLGTSLAFDAPTVAKEYSLIGFSHNEEVAAFEVSITTDFGAHEDRYSLIEIWRVDSGAVLATFRQGQIERKWQLDAPKDENLENLAAQHPEWMLAEEAGGWQDIQKKTRFQKVPVTMNDSSLRLYLDSDVRVSVSGDARKIEISALPGSGIGYRPVVRLSSGHHVALGHVRASHPDDSLLNAEVVAFHSPSGRKVVILNKFISLDGDRINSTTKPHLVALEGHPIGSPTIGTFSLARANLQEAEQIFGTLHPEAMQLYKSYLGNYW